MSKDFYSPPPPAPPLTPAEIHARIEKACATCLLIKSEVSLAVTRATLARERLEEKYRTEDQIFPAPSKDFLIGVAQGLLAAARTVNTQ